MALTYGSRGDDVLEYQKQMKAAGFDPGPLDGIYGKRTEAANTAYKASMQQATSSLAPPSPASSLAPPDPAAGLIGLRSTAERMGANVGWSPETGATLNGAKVNTAGMVNKDNAWYGKPEDIYGLVGTSKAPEYQTGGGMFSPEEMQGLVQKILNPQAFSFDASNPMIASMMGQAEQQGEKAFNNNIADMTSLTGGRLNSWAAGQASQARSGAMTDIMPQLYEMAYGMWNDSQDRNLTNLNALMGVDETMYGRSRDSYGDMISAANTGLGIENQKFERGIDERNYGRDVMESDRNYGRDVLESDRNYNRDVLESNRDYGLRAASSRGSSEESNDITGLGSPEQVQSYYDFLDIFSGGGNGTYKDNPAAAYTRLVGNRGQIEKMVGTKLYNKLVSDIKGIDAVVGTVKAPADAPADPTLGAIYSEMMSAPDPAMWLKKEAPYMTDTEIEQALKWLPKEEQAGTTFDMKSGIVTINR